MSNQYGGQWSNPTGGESSSGQPNQPPYGQPGQYPPPAAYPQGPVSAQDEKTWAMLAHAGGILVGFVAGLVVWLIYKDRSAYLKDQGAEALNFQITIAIGYVAASVLSVIGIGLVLYPVVWILQIVFGIIGAVAANKHENYRYPFAVRLIK